MVSALVVNEWAQLVKDVEKIFPVQLKDRLQQCLLESIYFDEIALSYTKILQDTRDYILTLKNCGITVDENLCSRVSIFFCKNIYQNSGEKKGENNFFF